MNCVTKEIKISIKKPAILIPLSDIHVGHVDHDKKLFTDTVAWIKRKNAHVILLGDLIDGISQKDRRFENNSIAEEFLGHLDNLHHRQVEVFLETIMPIKKNIIAVMGGNHELTVKKNFGYDATKVIAKALDKPVLTDPGYVVLRFTDNKASVLYNIFCSHGCWMGGRKRGSKINSIEDKMTDFEFDLLLAGHTHDLFCSHRKRLGISNKGFLQEQRKTFINTGSFLQTYTNGNIDTWASRSVFSPQNAGVARVDFYIKRNENQTRYIDAHVRI